MTSYRQSSRNRWIRTLRLTGLGIRLTIFGPVAVLALTAQPASAEATYMTWTCMAATSWTMLQPEADYLAGLRPTWTDCEAWRNGDPGAGYVWSYGPSVTTTTTSTVPPTTTEAVTTTTEPETTTTWPTSTTSTTTTSTTVPETTVPVTTSTVAPTTTQSPPTTQAWVPPPVTTTSTTTTTTTTTTLPEPTTTIAEPTTTIAPTTTIRPPRTTSTSITPSTIASGASNDGGTGADSPQPELVEGTPLNTTEDTSLTSGVLSLEEAPTTTLEGGRQDPVRPADGGGEFNNELAEGVTPEQARVVVVATIATMILPTPTIRRRTL